MSLISLDLYENHQTICCKTTFAKLIVCEENCILKQVILVTEPILSTLDSI